MPVTLYVDGARWRSHLRHTVSAEPDLVPVIKGNGYGFGLGRLARRAEWLGSSMIAVGTYGEVPEVASRCTSDIERSPRVFSRIPRAMSVDRLRFPVMASG